VGEAIALIYFSSLAKLRRRKRTGREEFRRIS